MAQRIARMLPILNRSHRPVAGYVLAHPLQPGAVARPHGRLVLWRAHLVPPERRGPAGCAAFPRYFGDTVLLAQRVSAAGVPVLALTDRVTSPLAPWVPLPCIPTPTASIFPTPKPAVLALIETLGSAVAHGAKDSVKAAAQLAEAMLLWLHSAAPARFRAIKNAGKPLARKLAVPSKLPKVLP